MPFNIYYPADPVTMDQTHEIAKARVHLRNLELPYEARAKYICHLIADQFKFRFKFARLYKSSYQWIGLEKNPVRVGVELTPKHKKLPFIDKGIVMPDGEIHYWNVAEPVAPIPDERVQDFDIPCPWFYGGDITKELKEGVIAFNKLPKEKKK